jgi:hypothetical protein
MSLESSEVIERETYIVHLLGGLDCRLWPALPRFCEGTNRRPHLQYGLHFSRYALTIKSAFVHDVRLVLDEPPVFRL